MNRIALVEDHERLAMLVQQALQSAGVPTDIFHTLEDVWTAHRAMGYAVLVIDRGLPDGDGLSLVKRLRAAGLNTPCLMLTARDALHDRVEGLDNGADDYLTKPFPMQELIARVRALLRRPATLRLSEPSCGDLRVSLEEGRMQCATKTVTLAPAELQIMATLMHHAGRTVRRAALEAAAWGLSEAVTPNALDVAVHRLRRKLLVVGSSLQITNVRNHGYALRDESLAS